MPDLDTLKFGHTFTDHMLIANWESGYGWHDPKIQPYGPLQLDPAASCLHYALECFEGMKAYKDPKGKVWLFRPDMNMIRINGTAQRLCLPQFDGEGMLQCLDRLVDIDREWVPSRRGFSLYIRPTLIGTHPVLGVGPPLKATLFVILSPVGPYYRSGFKAVRLFADSTYVRAWPGGTGNVKCGGNYGLTIGPQMLADKKGFDQIMWLFGPEHNITEVGTMNMFFFWINEKGQKELITPPLDGTILPGVTRNSILALAREWNEFTVSERPLTIHQVIKAIQEQRVIEAFGAGTAAVVSPVKSFTFEETEYKIPLDPKDPSVEAGPLTRRFLQAITDIQYGESPHPWRRLVG
eukprot:c1277_g1_i1.p1 GENE.c1277_g1_i1~~c1277_g1_i1.p1  ORF type:complete len:398 (+),score=81.31 c1277_g1_i1:142-1194(+)